MWTGFLNLSEINIVKQISNEHVHLKHVKVNQNILNLFFDSCTWVCTLPCKNDWYFSEYMFTKMGQWSDAKKYDKPNFLCTKWYLNLLRTLHK